MKRCPVLLICLISTLSTAAVKAQDADDLIRATSTAPVAYVYISLSKGIDAFAAATDGKLTRVPGSPFAGDVVWMAANGKYLFGDTANGLAIDSFAIASGGALKQVAELRYPASGLFVLDHTGATLYQWVYNPGDSTYEAFDIEKSTGELRHHSTTVVGPDVYATPSFIGNNVFSYYATTYHWAPYIFSFKRETDGSLLELSIGGPYPEPKPGTGDVYTFTQAVGDPANHVAIAVQAVNGEPFGTNVGPPQLATYTVSPTGVLSTASNFANMPATEVGYIYDINMSPTGKLLAVGGPSGLQVFHFNGASPITKYTGLIARDQVVQMFWDNDNHLYALCEPANKLFAFTVTPTSVTEAPGSPYSIAGVPQNLVVLPTTQKTH